MAVQSTTVGSTPIRMESHMILFDLQKGDERASAKLTVLRSQIETQKAYTPKYPQFVIYKKNAS